MKKRTTNFGAGDHHITKQVIIFASTTVIIMSNKGKARRGNVVTVSGTMIAGVVRTTMPVTEHATGRGR